MKTKHIIYLLIALPLLTALFSCDNDGLPFLSPGSGVIYEHYKDTPLVYKDIDPTGYLQSTSGDLDASLGYFGDMGAVNWYRIDMSSGNTYTFESTGNMDLVGKLYNTPYDETDRVDELVDNNDDGGDGDNFYINYTCTESGTYYLQVTLFDEDDEGGTYTLDYSY